MTKLLCNDRLRETQVERSGYFHVVGITLDHSHIAAGEGKYLAGIGKNSLLSIVKCAVILFKPIDAEGLRSLTVIKLISYRDIVKLFAVCRADDGIGSRDNGIGSAIFQSGIDIFFDYARADKRTYSVMGDEYAVIGRVGFANLAYYIDYTSVAIGAAFYYGDAVGISDCLAKYIVHV